MRIAVPRETAPGERRVGLVPDGVARLVKAGHSVTVETGISDGVYTEVQGQLQAGDRVVIGLLRPEDAGKGPNVSLGD